MEKITLQTSADVAKDLHQHKKLGAEAKALEKIVIDNGATLKPMHPGTNDPLLITFFMVEVPDETPTEQLMAHLRNFKTVEAVYIKPPDELP